MAILFISPIQNSCFEPKLSIHFQTAACVRYGFLSLRYTMCPDRISLEFWPTLDKRGFDLHRTVA